MRRLIALTMATYFIGPLANAGDYYITGGVGVSKIDDTVDTTTPSLVVFGDFPNEVSLNGRPFDSDETASELAVGWKAREWLSVELGYTDFGNAGQSLPTGLFGPVPVARPANPPLIPPAGFVGVAPVPIAPDLFSAALSMEEWSLAAVFRKPLLSDLSANWSIGVTRAQFDAEGRLTVNEIVTLDPLVLNSIDLPYASPKSETGYRFGFGFDWRINERFSADVGYRRHDTRVITIETILLRLIVTL